MGEAEENQVGKAPSSCEEDASVSPSKASESKASAVNPFTLAQTLSARQAVAREYNRRKRTEQTESVHTDDENDDNSEEEEEDDDEEEEKPPTRPKSAYFLFAEKFRSELKEKADTVENEEKDNQEDKVKMSVADVAKRCGAAWRELSEEDRQPFLDQSAALKEEYNQALQAFQERNAGKSNGGKRKQKRKEKKKRESELELPISRVAKIAKKDPEVKKLSKEAAIALTKATELFLGKFASAVWRKSGGKKKTLGYDAVVACVRHGPPEFMFLEDDFNTKAPKSL